MNNKSVKSLIFFLIIVTISLVFVPSSNADAVDGSGWREDAGGASSALDNLGGNWGTYTNFPLTATVDYINNRAYVAYVEDTGTDVLHVKSAPNNKDLTIAANWLDASFPTVTETGTTHLSLTSLGPDLFLFYKLDTSSGVSVYRRCNASGGGDLNTCDNSSDWSGETDLLNSTGHNNVQAIVTKASSDTAIIDSIFHYIVAGDVEYYRTYADLEDSTYFISASENDAQQRDCVSGTDDQIITQTSMNIAGRTAANASCDGSVASESHTGYRFLNIIIPPGTVISSAYLDVSLSGGTNNGPVDFTIYAEDVDNSSAFTALTDCTPGSTCTDIIGERSRTSRAYTYSIDFDELRYRIDVTELVQEIVCRGAGSTQPCVGDFNSSGSWSSGNAISLLVISNEGGAVDNAAPIHTYDYTFLNGAGIPKLQINVAPGGTTGKKYSMGSGTQLPTGAGSVADLDHPFSNAEFNSVAIDDINYASVSATTNYASASAQPAFMFKVNNSNNNNTYKIDASAILRSSLAASNKPIYLQVYRGGSTDDWVTVDSDSATASDTDITLTGSITTNLSEYYFNETPGIGTQYAECTDGTANCWSYWRIFQDAPGTNQNINLALDFVDISFSEAVGTEETPRIKGGSRLRGGTRIR